jgi:hypothetical protein
MLPLNNDNAFSLSTVMNIRLGLGQGISPAELNEVINSIRTNKIVFFKNQYGIESGYIIWCDTNDYTLKRFFDFKVKPRFFSEWNEGKNTIVLQLINNSKNSPLAVSELLGLRSDWNRIFYLTRKNGIKSYQAGHKSPNESSSKNADCTPDKPQLSAGHRV